MNSIAYAEQLPENVSKEVNSTGDDLSTIYKIGCENGCGKMIAFHVFTGVELIYDEFDAANCFCGIQKRQKSDDIMDINYCKEGRSESRIQNGSNIYLGEGDLSINMLCNHPGKVGFPLKHYRGIDIAIHLNEFSDAVLHTLPNVSIDIQKLREKFCPNNNCFITREMDNIKHIFSDIYTVSQSIQLPYFKLKVLELLLYFKILNISESNEQHEYYLKQQIEIIKQIHDKITKQPQKRYTIESLSNEYGISRTVLKSCFKEVYGNTIGAYMKAFRMQYAAFLLNKTTQDISSIAAAVGYENQSRFGMTFKKVMGKTPLKYRKSCPIGSKSV